jgi:hypothetical protein
METYIVKSGDTPWKLATSYVQNGNRWPELCAANPQLVKHPTYGCVFKVGGQINLPDSWIKPSFTTAQTTITTQVPMTLQEEFEALLGKKPVSVNVTTTGQQTTITAQTASPATAALTTPPNTAPVATNTAIPPSAALTTASVTPGLSPTMLKIGLVSAGIIALGAIVYWGISDKSGEHDVSGPKTVKMAPNRRRGRRRKGRRHMRHNAHITKEEAVKEFRKYYIPAVVKRYGLNDKPAMRQAWNDYTDYLHRQGHISDRAVNNWTSPFG